MLCFNEDCTSRPFNVCILIILIIQDEERKGEIRGDRDSTVFVSVNSK
jgi:hypothetical protein